MLDNVGAGLLTLMLRVALPVPPALVALIAMLAVLAVSGMPVIKPVAALSVSQLGSPVAPKLVGLLVAVI